MKEFRDMGEAYEELKQWADKLEQRLDEMTAHRDAWAKMVDEIEHLYEAEHGWIPPTSGYPLFRLPWEVKA